MLNFYQFVTTLSRPGLESLLRKRALQGKEMPDRLGERMGRPARARPEGPLVWIHAASVGEAQSMLILIDEILKLNPALHVLVTTGTTTSAGLMAEKLPQRCFHQFYPLDHPQWVSTFLEHWKPDLVFWMESELWPTMLSAIKARQIPAVLLNARLSERSFRRWRLLRSLARKILGNFTLILTQTQKDSEYFAQLGAKNLKVTDNLKFSARPLPAAEDALREMTAHLRGRPAWVFASTHKGEEEIACRVHQILRQSMPELLSIIVPRHPGRGGAVADLCKEQGLSVVVRGETRTPPGAETDIYIVDTMGELGLFYRLAPVACIGRSFSDDGGGGHNPIEAAQLNCVVLHGPKVQNLADIYAAMNAASAAFKMKDEQELTNTLRTLLSDDVQLRKKQKDAHDFALGKQKVIETVMRAVAPLLEEAKILRPESRIHSA